MSWSALLDDFRTLIADGFDFEICKLLREKAFLAPLSLVSQAHPIPNIPSLQGNCAPYNVGDGVREPVTRALETVQPRLIPPVASARPEIACGLSALEHRACSPLVDPAQLAVPVRRDATGRLPTKPTPKKGHIEA